MRCGHQTIAQPTTALGTQTFLETGNQKGTKEYVRMTQFLKRLAHFATFQTGGNNSALPTVTVKKEPEDIPSTSHQAQQQVQQQQQQPTIAVSIASAQGTQHTLVDTGNGNDNQPQHIVTQQENTDGSTSLSIAQVQPLTSTHQLTLSNINQVDIHT